jgi:preprotein translocase subunit SecA
MMNPVDRQAAYNADITYGTNSEFGFDYLRDNMAKRGCDRAQRELQFAIVDEVDSILVDEARTPLIISGAGEESSEMYVKANQVVRNFSGIQEKEKASKLEVNDEEYEKERLKHDFTIDEKAKTVALTETGVQKVERALNIQDLSDPENTEIAHHINQALKANFLFKRDRDYVVSDDGQVKIVDEFTGRILEGRRYSEGLHQAIEAKENVKVERENQTLATITYQNFFRMYKKLSGMTGTAKTEEEEFQKIYSLDVVCVPTNKPMIRNDRNDKIYPTMKDKFNAVVEEVIEKHKNGQPVLVGTVSVEVSEYVSSLLKKKGVKHEVLNAKHHKKEAEIVAQAGRFGAVTIATNMAGRGTDILLGGNPDFMARKELLGKGYDESKIDLATGHQRTDDQEILDIRNEYRTLLEKNKKLTDEEHQRVVEAGGLAIIGTERHESRRIDNQLRGRAGRQGDPGESCFYISFEDDLMRLFGGERMQSLTTKLLGGEMALEAGMLSKTIENAQKRVEGRNFSTRINVLQYDDVMNTQRETIYSQRRRVLEGEDVSETIRKMTQKVIASTVNAFTADQNREEWNISGMTEELKRICIPYETKADVFKGLSRDKIIEEAQSLADKKYEIREKEFEKVGHSIKDLERFALLEAVDRHWMDHIDQMDQLRQGISLRSMAQRDPLQEYKIEGFDMFNEMNRLIQEDAVRFTYNATLNIQVRAPKVTGESTDGTPKAERPKRAGAVRSEKIGRNDKCPCGSGKKYKQCCGK